jgi:hypothetical protein
MEKQLDIFDETERNKINEKDKKENNNKKNNKEGYCFERGKNGRGAAINNAITFLEIIKILK